MKSVDKFQAPTKPPVVGDYMMVPRAFVDDWIASLTTVVDKPTKETCSVDIAAHVTRDILLKMKSQSLSPSAVVKDAFEHAFRAGADAQADREGGDPFIKGVVEQFNEYIKLPLPE